MSEGVRDAKPATAPPGWRALLFGRRARTVWTICTGVAIQAFGWFLVSTIMPSVVLELGSPAELSWGTTAFLALSIPGSAGAGYLKGRFGSRRLLIAASILVLASNLLGLASPDMAVFLVSRALQGLGEGMVLALCYIMVGDSLAPEEIAPTFGILSVVWALATLVGPSLAGLLTALLSWRLAFLPMLVVASVFLWLVMTGHATPKAGAPDRRPLPLARLGIVGLAIGCISFAGASRSIPLALLLTPVTLILIGLALRLDRLSAAHLFPSRLMSLRQPSTLGIWILGLMYAAEAAAPLYMVYFVQIGHSTSVFFAGQFSTITALSWSVTALAISRFDKRKGRSMLILGPLLLTLGLALLVFWSSLPLAAGALALFMLGSGFGLSYSFITEYVIALAAEGERDVTAGAVPTLENVLAAMGAAAAGLLGNAAGFAGSAADDIPPSVPIVVFGVCTAVSAVALACAIRFYRLVRDV
jgi:MFS family permease